MTTYSVLIVDDNENDRYILKRELNSLKLDITIFESDDGKTALEFLNDYETKREQYADIFPPIVIFLDINMPFIDGFTFLSEFSELKNKYEKYHSVVVMMFTSSEMETEREKALSHQCVIDYLIKGDYSPDDLKIKFDKAIERNK